MVLGLEVSLSTPPVGVRYTVLVVRQDSLGTSSRITYCASVAEARQVAMQELATWKRVGADEIVPDPLNGFSLSRLPAALIAARTKRYGAALVGKACAVSNGQVTVRETLLIVRH